MRVLLKFLPCRELIFRRGFVVVGGRRFGAAQSPVCGCAGGGESRAQWGRVWSQSEVSSCVGVSGFCEARVCLSSAASCKGFVVLAITDVSPRISMVFLFRSGRSVSSTRSFSAFLGLNLANASFWEKIRVVLKATRQHARNLATYAMIYKTSMLLLRAASPSGKEASSHTFLAGLVGGYVVFGRSMHSSVNQQIVIYVFARVVLALAKLAVREGSGISQEARTRITTNAWPVFASLSWAFVMWIFRWHPETIQPSLRSSMRYMYVFILLLSLHRLLCRVDAKTLGFGKKLAHGCFIDM